jgi:hypothetical protein
MSGKALRSRFAGRSAPSLSLEKKIMKRKGFTPALNRLNIHQHRFNSYILNSNQSISTKNNIRKEKFT